MVIVSKPDLSIIIPSLNEAKSLPRLLAQLKGQRGLDIEIIVSDGGSSDGTQALAQAAGVLLVEASRGRAQQMNAGFRLATADSLLFLHSDSEIQDPLFLFVAFKDWVDEIEEAGAENIAGHFQLKFIRDSEGQDWAFRYPEEKSATNRLHTINGDQGLLIKRSYFQNLGGFNEDMGYFEDQIIADQIFRTGRWILLPGQLLTSGRRFEAEGFHRRYILMSLMVGLYWTGVHQFFVKAKGIYREQSEASRLQMWPFFRAIWDIMKADLGGWGSVKAWYRVGRYVRQNSWQMFFFFDVAFRPQLGKGRYPFLKFHDKVFWPLTNHRLGDALNAVFCFTWFMLILGPYFYWVDKKEAP